MLQMLDAFIIMAKCRFRGFLTDERGDVNIVSMVVLIGIAVLLAVVFKNQISGLIKSLVDTIGNNANSVVTTPAD